MNTIFNRYLPDKKHHPLLPFSWREGINMSEVNELYKLKSFFFFLFLFSFNFALSWKRLILISFDTGFLQRFTYDKVLSLTQQNL